MSSKKDVKAKRSKKVQSDLADVSKDMQEIAKVAKSLAKETNSRLKAAKKGK